MQKPTDELMAEVSRVISTPPSRPIRLIFLENEVLYEMAQNEVKELFSQSEIVNMSDFMESSAWNKREEELEKIEEKYGQEHRSRIFRLTHGTQTQFFLSSVSVWVC